MKFEDIKSSIEEKLGEEIVAKISDDMASLMTINKEHEDLIEEKNKEIKILQDDKETLIKANGNLLKQVPMTKDEGSFERDDKKEEKTFSYRSIFDEKGNIKRQM